MFEKLVGSVVWLKWPDDPKQDLRPGIVVSAWIAESGETMCRVMYGTSKLPKASWVVQVDDVDAQGLGLNRATCFDPGKLCITAAKTLRVAGHVDDVLGLREALSEARKLFLVSRRR
jgi:hypothetical protein